MTDDKPEIAEKEQSAASIVAMVEEAYELGRSFDGMLFAAPRDPAAARRAVELRSLRPRVTSDAYRLQGRVPGPAAVSAAFDTLAGLAADAPESPIYNRSARVGAAIHLDLGDRDGTFVEVSRYGWEIRSPDEERDPEAARPLFTKTAATRELPRPVEGGDRDELRGLLGLSEEDRRWRLIWGWLVVALLEDVPRPILWALGSQGSGKTTRAKMILDLLDPAERLGNTPGKSERDDSTSAAARFVPSWDNIGNVSAATSDWLCRLVTGVSVDRRALYTDDDLRTRTLRRTGIATSIVLPYGLGADALERLVLIEFERLPETERRSEGSLRRAFEEARPRILGALLSDLAGVLRHLGNLHDAEDRGELGLRLPRMADYALGLHALDIHTEHRFGFASAYVESVAGVLADRALSDPLTAALIAHVRRHGGTWRGQPSALLLAIDRDRPEDPRAAWPHGAAGLGGAIRRSSETFRAAGLVVSEGKSNGSRWIELTVTADAEAGSVEGSAGSATGSALEAC